jgi:hypothetical protein
LKALLREARASRDAMRLPTDIAVSSLGHSPLNRSLVAIGPSATAVDTGALTGTLGAVI